MVRIGASVVGFRGVRVHEIVCSLRDRREREKEREGEREQRHKEKMTYPYPISSDPTQQYVCVRAA